MIAAIRYDGEIMAKSTSTNGHTRLDEAMALLIQNQAALVGQVAEVNVRHFDLVKRLDTIELELANVVRVLHDHSRQLEQLTEAVRDRIGFKSP